MKTVKIGILGLGTVGGGTYEILAMNRELIEKRIDRRIEVVKVLEKNMESMLDKFDAKNGGTGIDIHHNTGSAVFDGCQYRGHYRHGLLSQL